MNNFKEIIERGERLYKELLKNLTNVDSIESNSNSFFSKEESYIEWHKEYEKISVNSGWRKMYLSIYRGRLYTATAAAAIIVLLISLFHSTSLLKKDNFESTIISNILPATDNIILKTSTGESIIIDSISSLDTIIEGVFLEKDQINYGDNLDATDSDVDIKEKSHIEPTKGREIQFNELYIPKGRVFSLVLSDGSKVWINSESYIKYPVKFGADYREVYISGEAFFDIKPDVHRDFIVKTDSYSINVLGTKFNLRTYENDDFTSTTLVEGSLSVRTDINSEFRISPGEQLTLEKKSNTVSISNVDVNLFTSWIDNLLILDKNKLYDIFKVLQRRYDIELFFTDEEAKYEEFSGILPLNDNLNIILDQLSKVSEIEFQIEGKLVVVRYR